jgi:hypothetical protein
MDGPAPAICTELSIGRMAHGAVLGFGLSYKATKANILPDDTVEGSDVALMIGTHHEHLMNRMFDGSLLL